MSISVQRAKWKEIDGHIADALRCIDAEWHRHGWEVECCDKYANFYEGVQHPQKDYENNPYTGPGLCEDGAALARLRIVLMHVLEEVSERGDDTIKLFPITVTSVVTREP